MTCIVGIEHQGKVWMGADSAYSDGRLQGLLAADSPKIWRAGAHVVGVAGSARVADILRFQMTWPEPPARGLLGYVVRFVVPKIRTALRRGGRMQQEHDHQGGYGAEGGDVSNMAIMLAVNGKLFTIEDDFQVNHARGGYDAIGSGEPVALGALHASKGLEPRSRLKMALVAAEMHTCGVRRPWRMLSTR